MAEEEVVSGGMAGYGRAHGWMRYDSKFRLSRVKPLIVKKTGVCISREGERERGGERAGAKERKETIEVVGGLVLRGVRE